VAGGQLSSGRGKWCDHLNLQFDSLTTKTNNLTLNSQAGVFAGDHSSDGEFNVQLDGEQGEANAGGCAGCTRTRSAAQVAAAGGAVRQGGRWSTCRARGGGATSGISCGRGAGRRGRRQTLEWAHKRRRENRPKGTNLRPSCLVQHRPISFFSNHCGLGDAHGTPEHRRGNAEM
jgi:hypothetical protein